MLQKMVDFQSVSMHLVSTQTNDWAIQVIDTSLLSSVSIDRPLHVGADEKKLIEEHDIYR